MNIEYLEEWSSLPQTFRCGLDVNRFEWIEKYSFAIPSVEAIRTIGSLGPIIEIGCGSGYWIKVLRDFGFDAIGYDNDSWELTKTNRWIDVLKGGPADIAKHRDRILFLCWPYMDSMAMDCLKVYKGNVFAYIGEGCGGCTADDEFFAELDNWQIEEIEIPQWYGLNDRLWICRR